MQAETRALDYDPLSDLRDDRTHRQDMEPVPHLCDPNRRRHIGPCRPSRPMLSQHEYTRNRNGHDNKRHKSQEPVATKQQAVARNQSLLRRLRQRPASA